MRTWLLDTGPFIAYFNRNDPAHEAVTLRLEKFSGQIVTTSAVVTEVMYFLSEIPDGPVSFAELLLVSGTRIAALKTADVVATAELMNEYADTPMDFADATLVLLAEELGVTQNAKARKKGGRLKQRSGLHLRASFANSH